MINQIVCFSVYLSQSPRGELRNAKPRTKQSSQVTHRQVIAGECVQSDSPSPSHINIQNRIQNWMEWQRRCFWFEVAEVAAWVNRRTTIHYIGGYCSLDVCGMWIWINENWRMFDMSFVVATWEGNVLGKQRGNEN